MKTNTFFRNVLGSLGFLSSTWIFGKTLPVQAVIVTNDFSAIVDFGPFAGEVATGTFSYDDDLIVNGDEILTPFEGLTLELTFLGQTYTEIDDVEFDFFPVLEFFEGSPIFLDYLVIDGFPTDILNPDIVALSIEDVLFPVGENNFVTSLDVLTSVNEPNSIINLLLLGGLGISSSWLSKKGKQ